MDYSYDYYFYSTDLENSLTEFFEMYGYAILGGILAVGLILMLVGVVLYVLESAGMYTIAKRRGINNPWLAWIPVVKYWLLGCISDQYQYVVKGKVKNKRKIMLILSIVNLVLSGLVQGASISVMMSTYGYEGAAVAGGALNVLASLTQSAVGIALLVYWHMALYDLYSSCTPTNNVLFLILGIIFTVTQPFFVFFSRHKDLGMPPRKDAEIPMEPQFRQDF